jgi:glycosyltransferase involved in cell wall biosynthesis
VGITGIDDLLDGELCLKTCDAKHVTFTDLTITPFERTCQLSVVITCNRFLQRLRVTLRNWCEQVLPEGSHELIVANPGSADGCHEYLATVARSYPHVGVREIAIDPALAMNKGAMINRAVAASHGQWVWLCDADCLFSPGAAAQVLRHLHAARPALYFGERHHLSEAQTDALLAGRLDGLRDFDALFARAEQRWHDCAPWGYTQIVPRSVLARWPYPETINHFAHTDTIFADHCRRRGLAQIAIPGLHCLHLIHPFAWYGTNTFL